MADLTVATLNSGSTLNLTLRFNIPVVLAPQMDPGTMGTTDSP